MFSRAGTLLFKVEAPREVRGATRVLPKRRRQFTRHPFSSETRHASNEHTKPLFASSIPPLGSSSGTAIPKEHESVYSQPSQRQRFRQFKEDEEASVMRAGVAGAYLSPLPKKYGFYDGIDAHGLEETRPTPESRRHMLQQALESQAASVVEFTDGGEADIELNGLPESEYHGKDGWTTVPKDSALFNSVHARADLESRQRLNSWSVARRKGVSGSAVNAGGEIGLLMGEFASKRGEGMGEKEGQEGVSGEVLGDTRRRQHSDGGTYSSLLEGELLEPVMDSIGQPRSTYGLRKMFVNGLVGYQGVVSRAEEAQVCEELLQLLQDHRAAYIAEESRYCVNLYESELGIPGKDTLAFAIERAPTLQRVLFRFFYLGLIPSPPNVCQVSEMIGTFSGYPVHRKPPSVGAYFGLLNLVSTTVMHMQHRDCPWFPRLHTNPRSLFVVSEPCLSEYAMGYKQTHQPFHAFEYATRVSKDYRIEVLFATVETEHTRHLSEAVKLTEYATTSCAALLPGSAEATSSPKMMTISAKLPTTVPSGSVDEWIERARRGMHQSESQGGSAAVAVDGNALRHALVEQHLVGEKEKPFMLDEDRETVIKQTSKSSSARSATLASPAQRRLAALKARHELAMHLREKSEAVQRRSGDGPTLIRGHAPGDKRRL